MLCKSLNFNFSPSLGTDLQILIIQNAIKVKYQKCMDKETSHAVSTNLQEP